MSKKFLSEFNLSQIFSRQISIDVLKPHMFLFNTTICLFANDFLRIQIDTLRVSESTIPISRIYRRVGSEE